LELTEYSGSRRIASKANLKLVILLSNAWMGGKQESGGTTLEKFNIEEPRALYKSETSADINQNWRT